MHWKKLSWLRQLEDKVMDGVDGWTKKNARLYLEQLQQVHGWGQLEVTSICP